MIKRIVRTSIGPLLLLVAATACALPASPPEIPAAGATQVTPVVVEVTPASAVETATAATLPAATEPVAVATQATEPTPLVVETPEKETSVVEPQPVEEITEEAAGPTDEQQWVLDGLPSLGEAPELRNDVWLNSEPLRLADLRGQVVLLDMWTFG